MDLSTKRLKKLIDILVSIEKNLKCCYELELKVEKNIGSGVEETKSDDTEKIGVSILFEPIEHLIEMIKSVCENDEEL